MAGKFAIRQHKGTYKWWVVAAALSMAACGSDADKPVAGIAADTGRHTAALLEGECDLDGTWAVKINVPVHWERNWGLQAGNGALSQYVKSKRTRDGDVVHEELTTCGITLPDYRSVMFQKFATRFPKELFDKNYLSPIRVDSYFSGFTAGSTFQTGSVVSEIGVSMPSALSDPWPARSIDLKHHVDTDEDGHPGVTLMADTGPGYSLPPSSPPVFGQALRFYTAIRNIADIQGEQQSCDKAVGTASIPQIGGKLALNSHVLGCELAAGGQCSAAQTKTLDESQPAYQVSDSNPGTVIMVRIDENATCEDIRNFDFN